MTFEFPQLIKFKNKITEKRFLGFSFAGLGHNE